FRGSPMFELNGRSLPQLRRSVFLRTLAFMLATGMPLSVQDQTDKYPDHPVKLIATIPPGSTTDAMLRYLAEPMSCRHQARHDELRDVAALALAGAQRRLDGRRHDLRIALVADPALFPAVVEVGLVAAEVIDEVHRHRMRPDQLGDPVLGAAQQRGGAVAVVHLAGRGHARHPLVGRRN